MVERIRVLPGDRHDCIFGSPPRHEPAGLAVAVAGLWSDHGINVAWLATFPLCALAAHVLVLTLTQRQDAALIGGLAYGFNPYRVAHLAHLELLAAFGMPLALVALHRFANDRRSGWIGILAMALVVQGLCTTYYLLFFCVFLALWVLWFVRVPEWRVGIAILAGCLACAVAIGPVLVGYWHIHQHYGFARILPEVLFYSADVSSLFAGTTLLSVWHRTAAINRSPELQLFPGLTITLLAVIGLATGIRREPDSRDPWRWVSLTLLLVACVFAIVAWSTVYIGPWAFTVGGLRIGTTVPFKPITTALLALAGGSPHDPGPVRRGDAAPRSRSMCSRPDFWTCAVSVPSRLSSAGNFCINHLTSGS